MQSDTQLVLRSRFTTWLLALAIAGCAPKPQTSPGLLDANVELSFPPCSTVDRTAPRIRRATAVTADSLLQHSGLGEVVLVLENITKTNRLFSAYRLDHRLVARTDSGRAIVLRARAGEDALEAIAFGFAPAKVMARYREGFSDTLYIMLSEHCDPRRK
jgi:hypothetical protein